MRKISNVPTDPVEFRAWLTAVVHRLLQRKQSLGLSDTEMLQLRKAADKYVDALKAEKKMRVKYEQAVEEKTAAFRAAEQLISEVGRQISEDPSVTDEELAAIGFGSRSKDPYRKWIGKEAPKVHLESRPGIVLVHFDERSNKSTWQQRPAWALCAKVYRKKAGERKYELLDIVEGSPYEDPISGSSVEASYVVQWMGRNPQDVGEESEPVTIQAMGALAA